MKQPILREIYHFGEGGRKRIASLRLNSPLILLIFVVFRPVNGGKTTNKHIYIFIYIYSSSLLMLCSLVLISLFIWIVIYIDKNHLIPSTEAVKCHLIVNNLI